MSGMPQAMIYISLLLNIERRNKPDRKLSIGSNNIKHYKIPGKELLDKGSPEVSWWLPLKKDFRKYELP